MEIKTVYIRIHKSNIPRTLILEYCRVITVLESDSQYFSELDQERKALHDKIFEAAGHNRSLYTRNAREFATALNRFVLDVTC